jgi:hypothetical protein
MLYFIKADHPVARIKIGTSSDPSERLKDLQTSSPTRLELLKVIPGNHESEAAWHARFAHLRSHLEWFEKRPELLRAIDMADSRHANPPPWEEPKKSTNKKQVISSHGFCQMCKRRPDCPGCYVEVSYNGRSVEMRWEGAFRSSRKVPS